MDKLIIVESPTKARTIGRFLPAEYQIMATMGHIRDLPKKRFGVKVVENGKIRFEPQYQIIPDKKKVVAELKEKVKKAKEVILATDPDREGEAIAYHVRESVGGKEKKEKFVRIVFHEITSAAVKKALTQPRTIDLNLVNAQQARRVLDRIVGYKLSPLLWRKVRQGLSAGRVQSVAVRLIVEREREIEEFKSEKYFRVWALFKTPRGEKFLAQLNRWKGKSVETKKKYPLFAGTYQTAATLFHRFAQAEGVIVHLPLKPVVEKVVERQIQRRPLPPFTTSKLQQTASRKFGWSSKLTMRVAQSLYEKGLITYHRTDSTNLSQQFVKQVRSLIEKKFGRRYLPAKPVFYKTRSRLAQEAHEAIRPTQPEKEKLGKQADRRQQQLYELIWQRAIACQMAPAKLASTSVEVKDNECLFVSRGTRLIFAGFSRVYPVVFSEVNLPPLKEKDKLKYAAWGITSHQTPPPPRYTEATLIAALEKEGIGRPSTYAPIIFLIQQRAYVEKEEGRFRPTNLGVAVNSFLVKHFPEILGLPFTAKMETNLDKVAKGEKEWMETVAAFWRPFAKKVEKTKKNSQRVAVKVEKVGEKCPECQQGELVIRVGKFGKFIACSRFPECKYTRPLVKEAGFNCPECGAAVVIRWTKKRKKFYGCSNWPSCKWASWKKPKG